MADEDEKKSRREDAKDFAGEAGEGGFEAVGEGCFGCDLVIALTLIAGLPLMLWAF